MKTAVVVPPGLAITDAGLISTAGNAVDPKIWPVPWPRAIVAAVGLERFTVKVLMNAPDGSGSTATVTLCWVWLGANIRGVVGTAT